MPAPRKNAKATSKKPVLATGAQIYDAIMGQIEPDLLSDAAERSGDRREGEGDAAYKERMVRYKRAFAVYDKCFSSYVITVMDDAKKTKLAVRRAAEAEEHVRDEEIEQGILSRIDSL